MALLKLKPKLEYHNKIKDFLIVSDANYQAYIYLDSWPLWQGKSSIIHGAHNSGKTALATYFAKISQAEFIDLYNMNALELDKLLSNAPHFIIDDFEKYFHRKSVLRNLKHHHFKDLEAILLRILNHAADAHKSVLLLTNSDPACLKINSADLSSRVNSYSKFKVTPPSEASLLSFIEQKNITENLMLSDVDMTEIISNCTDYSYRAANTALTEFIEKNA